MSRILVVRPDNVGDVLMAGPALRGIAAAAPAARLELLVSPAGAAAAGLLPEVDDVVVASVSWQRLPGADGDGTGDPDPDAELVATLAARRYDAAVVLTSFSQSPWPAAEVARRAGIGVRVGTSKEFGGSALTHWVPAPPDDGHQVDRMSRVVAAVGAGPPDAGPDPAPGPGPGPDRLHAEVPGAARARAAAVAHGGGGGGGTGAGGALPDGGPYVVLAPGASCSSRRYPPERFGAVAAALAADGLGVLVTGTDREADLVDAVLAAAASAGAPVAGGATGSGANAGTATGSGANAGSATGRGRVVGLAGALDLPGLAALMAGAALVVANNSGGVHLADAVGTPVVELFAGTETVGQYRPRSVPAEVLTVPTACAPCRLLTCPFAQECLDVAPAAVADAARRLLPLAVR